MSTDERQEARSLHLTQGGLRCLTVEPADPKRPTAQESFFNPQGYETERWLVVIRGERV